MNISGISKYIQGLSRNAETSDQVLLNEIVTTSPPEDGAAKRFIKFLNEHPEYNVDDINMRIDTFVVEEDAYGNGGGHVHRVVIYLEKSETPEEIKKRIIKNEDKICEIYGNELKDTIKNLYKALTPYIPDNETVAYKNRVSSVVMSAITDVLATKP